MLQSAALICLLGKDTFVAESQTQVAMMGSDFSVRFEWCSDVNASRSLAKFFADNVTTSYISHSELQGPRALDPMHWRPNIRDIFEKEISKRISETAGIISGTESTCPIFGGWMGDELVVFGMASFFPDAPVSYAMLEDVVVAESKRRHGLGGLLVDWIFEQARKANCQRVFLESGHDNHDAHQFFESKGFKACSVVMMKAL